MNLATALDQLRLPVLQAPMFLVSSQALAAACSRAGVVGAFQLGNPRSVEQLAIWLEEMAAAEQAQNTAGLGFAPYCVNINANAINADGYRERVDLCERARVPLC